LPTAAEAGSPLTGIAAERLCSNGEVGRPAPRSMGCITGFCAFCGFELCILRSSIFFYDLKIVPVAQCLKVGRSLPYRGKWYGYLATLYHNSSP
jgi:hypothetical protein